MINNKYKLVALILACLGLLLFLIGVIWFGSSIGKVGSETVKITSNVNEIEVGWNYQLEVDKNIDSNHHLEYTSSNNELLTITDTGYMSAKSVGEVTVTVQVKENKKVKDSIKINVVEPKSSLNISEKSIYLTPNEQRKIYVYNTNPEGYLIWETKDEYVATVNDGVIKAINYGETEVVVSNEEEISATIKVKVLSPEEEETIELQDIFFYEKNVGLDVGEKLQLTVIFDPRNVSDKSLVWSSSNPDAVTVSNDGVLTAVGDGNATITATASNGLVAKCETKSTTSIIPATGITINNNDLKMYVGDAYTLTATITPNNTTSKNIKWSSSNTSVATVDRGIVIALKEGTTTITASTNNGKTATAKVTITKKIIEPYSISIDKQTATISVGGKVTLVASITPYNATNKSVSWTSSDNNIATVNNGQVTGVSAGTATITARTSNGKTATSKITVSKEAINVTNISLSSSNITLNAGNTYTLKVTYTPSNATNQSVTWSSSNSSVATVTTAGVVKGVKGGTATITAKTSNGITATCNVEVAKADDEITIRKRTANYSGNTITASISSKSGTIKSTVYYSNSNCTNKTNTSNANTEGGPPKESGTYYVIVETSGNSNYNGVKSLCTEAVVINKKKAVITCTNKAYNGKQQVIATCTGGTLSNASQTNVGSYQIACTGTGAYTDASPKSCSITQRSISTAVVSGLQDVTYTGSAIQQTPTVKITIDGETKTLTNNVDYTYSIKNNINPGTATVTITGKGNYNSSKQATFKILKQPATVSCQNKEFNGTTQAIATCNGGTPTYNPSSPKDARDYTVGCSPDSSHSAPSTITCSITPYNFTSLIVDPIPSKTYTGSPITDISLNVRISINGTTYGMSKDRDYTYTISNNTNVGTARVTISGKGNYRGTFSTSFQITKGQAKITCKNNVVYTGSSQLIATCEGGSLVNAYQTNVGSYNINCNGDSNHNNASQTTCSIKKATDIPTITLKTVSYSNTEVKANVSAKTCGSSTCNVTYYVNPSCSNSSLTNSSSQGGNASITGGPPKAKGTYYVIAKSIGNENYYYGTSDCTQAIIIN